MGGENLLYCSSRFDVKLGRRVQGGTHPPPSPARFARQRDSGQHAICSQCHLLALEQLIAVHPHTMHTILSHQELGVKTIADLARWKVGVAAVLD